MILLDKPLLVEGHFFCAGDGWNLVVFFFYPLKHGKLGISESEKYKLDCIDWIEAITSAET